MTSERRFSEQEVAYILERAANADAVESESAVAATAEDESPGQATGMTLSQLTEIAREAGIQRLALLSAARAVEQGALVPTQQHKAFGLPVGVSRTAEFSRPVTAVEWERMVAAFRETFQARGTVRQDGSLRSWSNGNLHAMLEPTATGHRLRLSTVKGDAMPFLRLGAFGIVMAGVVGVALTSSASSNALAVPGILAALGALPILRTVITTPRWARTRAAQMESIAAAAATILNETDARAGLSPGTDGRETVSPARPTSLPTSYTDE